MTTRQRVGLLAFVAYALCIVGANYFITHIGDVQFPHGPHVIPVGFGFYAPSGVLLVGLSFTFRDFVQQYLGKLCVVGAILVGISLSYFTSTAAVATASAIAFTLSEFSDFAVYTPLVERGRTLLAISLSNALGLVVDTFVFLWVAFGSIQFWQGQVIGKAWMTVLAMAILIPARRRAFSS